MTDDHPRYRLGRRAPQPEHAARVLYARDYLTYQSDRLVPPAQVDHYSRVSEWGLYQNNNFGICGPTGAANYRRLITRYLTGTMVAPTQDDVNALYALQNPGFTGDLSQANGPSDKGVDLQTMCEQLVKVGIGGVKALGFAKVDRTNEQEVRECITLFGGLLDGADLEVAQQGQTDDGGPWNYVAESPDWGGHAFLTGSYSGDQDEVISWAEKLGMTASFRKQRLQESFVIIWPEHVEGDFMPNLEKGMNLKLFAEDYKQITGRKFPVSTPSTPPADPGGISSSPIGVTGAGNDIVSALAGELESFAEKAAAAAEKKWKPKVEAAENLLKEFTGKVEAWVEEHGSGSES